MRPEFERILKAGLYHTEYFSMSGEHSDIDDILDFLLNELRYDFYCPKCGKESVFKTKPEPKTIGRSPQRRPLIEDKGSTLKFICSRDSAHFLLFFFKTGIETEDGLLTLTKIGQFPSMADISNEDSRKYLKVLGRDRSREFNKAIGLVSHGVGIGSFVYLRRIFENLIEEAHSETKSETDWDEEEYLKARMNEKVGLLSFSFSINHCILS